MSWKIHNIESSIQGVGDFSGSATRGTHIFLVSSSGHSNIITGDERLNQDSLLASGQKVRKKGGKSSISRSTMHLCN